MRSIIIFIVALGFVVFIGDSRSIAQPILHPPNQDLQQNVDDAEANTKQAAFALDVANKNLQAIQDRLENKFDQNPDWIAASAKLDTAKSAFSEAKKNVESSLESNPDYIKAKTELKDVQDSLKQSKSDGDGPEVTIPLATEKMQDSAKVNKMKSDATADDPQVKSAKTDLASAQSVVDQFHTKFITTLSTDSDWNEANSIVDQKKALWVEAQSKQVAAEELLSQDESAKRQIYDEEMNRWSAENYRTPQAQGYGISHQGK